MDNKPKTSPCVLLLAPTPMVKPLTEPLLKPGRGSDSWPAWPLGLRFSAMGLVSLLTHQAVLSSPEGLIQPESRDGGRDCLSCVIISQKSLEAVCKMGPGSQRMSPQPVPSLEMMNTDSSVKVTLELTVQTHLMFEASSTPSLGPGEDGLKQNIFLDLNL